MWKDSFKRTVSFFLLLNMEHDKLIFRHILHYFDFKKTAAAAHKLKLIETYDNYVPTERTCQEWFQRFKSDDYDMNDKQRSDQPKKFENNTCTEL